MAELVIAVLDRCRNWAQVPFLDDEVVVRNKVIDYAFGRLDVTVVFDKEATLHSVCLTFDNMWSLDYNFKDATRLSPPRPEARLLQHDLTGLGRCVGTVLTSELPLLPPMGMPTQQWHQFMVMHPFMFKLTMYPDLMPKPPRQPLAQLYPPPNAWPAAVLRPVAAPVAMVHDFM